MTTDNPTLYHVKLKVKHLDKTLRVPVSYYVDGNKIVFAQSHPAAKDEIKAMAGAHWCGYDPEPRQVWTVDNTQRNVFNLRYMAGENVYEWFERPVESFPSLRPLMPHQFDLCNQALTYHYHIWAAEMGVGKTLSAQSVIEQSGVKHWWWVGPKSSLTNIQREFKRWGFQFELFDVDFISYEQMAKRVTEGHAPPQGIIFDESSRLGNWESKRTRAAAKVADAIRDTFGLAGFVILMSGTPATKAPTKWWSQCEIAWPGFLREGSAKALEQRLAYWDLQTFDAGSFHVRTGWRDNSQKCDVCGGFEPDEQHDTTARDEDGKLIVTNHKFTPGKNEVEYLFRRMRGLVTVKTKKECLAGLPDKIYRVVELAPSASLKRVAQVIAETSPNAMTALTLLRELSDGFQYSEKADGETTCPRCDKDGTVIEWVDRDDPDRTYSGIEMLDPETVDRLQHHRVACPTCGGSRQVPRMVRTTREIPCPKDGALVDLLEENEDIGRIVVAGGFTGSLERIKKLCNRQGWDVILCDGRGTHVWPGPETPLDHYRGVEPLDYWADTERNERVAFVLHPESGGMSLTLTAARMLVFWSNVFKSEYRPQTEDRIHRKGMDENAACTIVDLCHLPSDTRVLETVRDNRRLELMTLGDVAHLLAV